MLPSELRSPALCSLLLFAFGCTGCMAPVKAPVVGTRPTEPTATDANYTVTVSQLDEMTRAYADRYMTLVHAACEDIERDNPSPEQRRMAHLFRTGAITAIYDIATNPDPFTRLLDMVLVVTLQTQVWIDEARADEAFGDRAERLVQALRSARENIWDIAEQVMRPEQLETLDFLIWDWRRQHPEVEFVSFVRFDDFSDSRGKSVVLQVASGGGLLAPISEAKQAVEEARMLSERIFYYGKRAGFLVGWQTKVFVNDLLAMPEFSQALGDFSRISVSTAQASAAIEKVGTTIDALPGKIAAEREALLAAIDERQTAIDGTLREVRGAVDDTERLAKSLDQTSGSIHEVILAADKLMVQVEKTGTTLGETVDSVDRMLGRFDAPPATIGDPGAAPAHPFDINDYTNAMGDLAVAARELNSLVHSSAELLQSPAWKVRLNEARAETDVFVQRVFWLGMALIVTFFVCMGGYRVVIGRVVK